MIAAVVFYILMVVVVGAWATRTAGKSPEEYFLAGRRLGLVVLFMALFGTNSTAFVFIGAPGKAYHEGVGMFSINAPIVALCTPLTFLLVGIPARRMAGRLKALTPAELYSRRFGSHAVGILLFLFYTAYTIPYMVLAVKGAAITLEGMTGGAVTVWMAALAIVGVALIYVTLGGMQATAWTNVLQGVIFLGFLIMAFFFISNDMGGLKAAMESVRAHDESLLEITRQGLYEPRKWISWSLVISLAVIAFPHMFVRLMAAGSEQAIKGVCRLYPIALLALWLPPVLIGIWGAVEFPGFTVASHDSDRILQLMVDKHMPAALGGLGLVAVLAVVMSSLDAMILTLSSMLLRDALRPVFGARSESAGVMAGRLFGLAIGAGVFVLSLTWDSSVFDIGRKAFSGFVALTPTLFLGVLWKRFTAAGAIASLLVGNGVLFLGFAGTIPLGGFLPVFWALIAGVAAALVVSLATRPTEPETLERAFG
ncbi:hypothetical protein ABI59_09610 [Acidobacteria bacterium Mor1]|nr:hypothetical protein ABI59_09610 [Acidobacteria bacterium Mor1]